MIKWNKKLRHYHFERHRYSSRLSGWLKKQILVRHFLANSRFFQTFYVAYKNIRTLLYDNGFGIWIIIWLVVTNHFPYFGPHECVKGTKNGRKKTGRQNVEEVAGKCYYISSLSLRVNVRGGLKLRKFSTFFRERNNSSCEPGKWTCGRNFGVPSGNCVHDYCC